MSFSPLVVKLGGDALASPERIAAEARRLAGLVGAEPILAVTSARRGVTDHLLGLVEGRTVAPLEIHSGPTRRRTGRWQRVKSSPLPCWPSRSTTWA